MATLLEEFMAAVKGTGGQVGGRSGMDYLQYAAMATDPAYQQLFIKAVLPWFERMAKRVPLVWFHPDVARKCALTLQDGPCRARAAAMCSVCRRNVCLSHSYVSCEAQIVCQACVNVSRRHVEPVINSDPTEEERTRKAQGGGAGDLQKAYKLLQLDAAEADDDAVEAAYRRLLKKWHPDRVESADKKQKHEEKFKQIRWAYDTVKAARGMT